MSHRLNGIHPSHQKNETLFSVRRALILGYYDGALDGVLESSTGEVFRFELVGEEHEVVLQKQRTYQLRPMPADALDRLVGIIEPYMQPRWPSWFPRWAFPDDATQRDVERRTNIILDEAGPAAWIISTEDFVSFSNCSTQRIDEGAVLTN